MRIRAGFSLIEVMIALFLFGLTFTVFASLFPMSQQMRAKSEDLTRATTLAQQKIEQVRALSYADLTYAALRVASIIDTDPNASPFSFTEVDSLASKLPQCVGTLAVTDVTTDLRRVDVTLTWGGVVAGNKTFTLSTFVANKEMFVQ